MIKKKRGLEFSFAWMFSILVGAVIIFLAIYGTMRFVKTGRYQIDTITAKQLSIIFEPLETGLASGKSNVAKLTEETRIYNKCFSDGNFGKHKISLATKQGIGGSWQRPGGEIDVLNKYIFSGNIEQGKEVYFFSKPFKLPWKISEIIFLSAEKYCFINPPEYIRKEVSGLRLRNVKSDNCSAGDIKVCFKSGIDCDIVISGSCITDCDEDYGRYDYGYISKKGGGNKVFYAGSLIYAGIFSSEEVYECNVKRLIKRLIQQALVYRDESDFLSVKCGAVPSSGLIQLINAARDLNNSEDLLLIRQVSKEVEKQNDASECKLW